MDTKFANYTMAAFNVAKSGTRDLVAAVTNKQIWVYGLVLHGSSGDGTMLLQDETAPVAGVFTITVAVNNTIVLPISNNGHMPWFKCNTGKKLQVLLSTNLDLDGCIVYAHVDV